MALKIRRKVNPTPPITDSKVLSFPKIPDSELTEKDKRELLELNATLDVLVKRATSINKDSRDYSVIGANANNFRMTYPLDISYLPTPNGEEVYKRREVGISEHALGQLCNKINVPYSYVRKLVELEEFGLAHENVETMLNRFNKDLFVREYQDNIRGILSTRYSVLDTHEVMDVLLNSDLPFGNLSVKGSYLTPERFHLRLTESNPLIKKDDLFGGVQIDSSDVGRSTLRVQFLVFKQICTNGLVGIVPEMIFQQKHIGVSKDVFYNGLVASLEKIPEMRRESIELINIAKNKEIFDPKATKENQVITIRRLTAEGEENAKEILEMLTEKYDNTRWGLANTLTDWAQKFTLERRLDYEALAGQIARRGAKVA